MKIWLIFLVWFLPLEASADTDWAAVDSRSETVYKTANYGIFAGIAISIGGGLSGNTPLQTAGSLTYFGSGLAMAGSALRQRRSIEERGVKVSGVWGYASWTLQAASIGLGEAAAWYENSLTLDPDGNVRPEDVGPLLTLILGSIASSIGATLTASKQHHENIYRRGLIGRVSAEKSSSGFRMAINPLVSIDGTLGLGATAVF